tara:strand:- start:1775 stop:2068 length:294 start_codon:yes stop_codon:yes gene_type:complete
MAKTLTEDLLTEIKNNIKNGLGGCGSEIIDGTAAVTGNWFCVVPLDATQFDVSGCSTNIANFPTDSDIVIAPGVPLFGDWTSIQLIDGSVQAYVLCT